MRTAPALVAILAGPAFAAPTVGPHGELRLTPSEIARLEVRSGGAGTSGVQGIRTIVLAGDPGRAGPYTIELRVPPRTRIASHTHRDDRTAIVISGTWYFGYGPALQTAGAKALRAGSFYTEPSGTAHFAMTRDKPAVLIINGIGPTDTRFVVGEPQQ